MDNKILIIIIMSFSVNNIPLNAPLGSIVAYVNSTQPSGWLVCDGSPIPSGNEYNALKTFLNSNNVPDLRGFFLRGIGNSSNNLNRGSINVREEQFDSVRPHTHNFQWNTNNRDGSGGSIVYRDLLTTSPSVANTTSTGSTQTTPVNYGIIWIIKA